MTNHSPERLVTALVVVIGLKEADHERLLSFRIVKDHDLLGRHVVRTLAAVHFALHLGYSFTVYTIEGYDSCERHDCLLCREFVGL